MTWLSLDEQLIISNLVAASAISAVEGVILTSIKADGTYVTNADERIADTLGVVLDKMAEKRDNVPKVVIEEFDPANEDGGTLYVVDPIDGTTDFKNGGTDWSVTFTEFHFAAPRYGVTATWGIDTTFRQPDGQIGRYFGSPVHSHGLVIEATEFGANHIRPLSDVRREKAFIEIPKVVAQPITHKSLLVTNKETCLTMGMEGTEGIRLNTCNSTINGQVRVILGLADAFICNSSPEKLARKSKHTPQIKLWDLFPAGVYNAGLTYVIAAGERESEIIRPDQLLSLCDESYFLTEQLLVCHQQNAPDIIKRIKAVKAHVH